MSNKTILTNRRYGASGLGADVRQVIPGAVPAVDPFVFLDHYGPFTKQPGWGGVPMHPHAGIATITYLLEGTNRHTDSYGHDVLMHEGDVAWMISGKGIEHAEGKHESGQAAERSHGIQFWISLPAADKFTEPSFSHYPAADLPRFESDDLTITLLAGELGCVVAPTTSLSPAFIYDLDFAAAADINLPIAEGDSTALYVIEGSATVDDTLVEEFHIADFSTSGDSLSIEASDAARIVVFGGTPLDEPIVSYASFVMNDEAQIQQVVQSYRDGKMRLLAD